MRARDVRLRAGRVLCFCSARLDRADSARQRRRHRGPPTGNRMHGEFLRLLFLQAHRETTAHFTAIGMPAQQHCDSFRFRRAASYNGLKTGYHTHANGHARVFVVLAAWRSDAATVTLTVGPLPRVENCGKVEKRPGPTARACVHVRWPRPRGRRIVGPGVAVHTLY